jgi:hypothetical protein
VLHHPRAQHHAQQLEHRLVHNPFLNRLHRLLMRNRRKAVGDIRLHHPPATPPSLIDDDLKSIVLPPLWAEPEVARGEVCLEDRLKHDLHRGLHDPVPNRGNRQRPLFTGTRLRDHHPTRRQRPIPTFPQLGGHLIEQPANAVLLDLGVD